MTDIEQKALALVNEVARELGWDETKVIFAEGYTRNEALFRAIEQHEAFRQEVSDAVIQAFPNTGLMPDCLGKFIIPKPKPDPLVAALEGVTFDHYPPNDAKTIRAALEARGLEIREKNDG